MADRPILFSTPMVRALLDGRKTQTRRVLKPKRGVTLDDFSIDMGARGIGRAFALPRDKLAEPKYQVGDRLWVRETWWRGSYDFNPDAYKGDPPEPALFYKATDGGRNVDRWKPSIHMPRAVSRLTLIVEAVRIERLRNISDADSLAEGAITEEWLEWREDARNIGLPPGSSIENERDVFARLWQSINGAGSWDTNPWVAAITFRVVHANIDALTEDGRLIREAAQVAAMALRAATEGDETLGVKERLV